MREKLAQWATTISAIISMFALIWAVYTYLGNEKDKKITEWQKVIVYKIILQKENANFEEISLNYVNEA